MLGGFFNGDVLGTSAISMAAFVVESGRFGLLVYSSHCLHPLDSRRSINKHFLLLFFVASAVINAGFTGLNDSTRFIAPADRLLLRLTLPFTFE